MRLAAIADVHGNLPALEAVLADPRRAAPDLVVNLGDAVSGPFDPAGTADALMALGACDIAGNHERQVLAGTPDASDDFARARLRPAHLDWLRAMPAAAWVADGVFACHGTPAGGDLDYLLEDVSTGGAVLASDADIRRRPAGSEGARLVLCGHTHVPRCVAASTGASVVDPGAVGMPAYADAVPVPHAMEAGSPHARYALLTLGPAGWSAELRAVAYDRDAAAAQAERHGRPEVAIAERSHGVMSAKPTGRTRSGRV